jgi:hypothetical protein
MMAGVTGKVIALVCAALVALPVSGHHLAYWHQSPHSDGSALAVAGIGGGTVLALVKALRFAPTLPGAFGGLDQGCARRERPVWATADGCYAGGSDCGWASLRRLTPRRKRFRGARSDAVAATERCTSMTPRRRRTNPGAVNRLCRAFLASRDLGSVALRSFASSSSAVAKATRSVSMTSLYLPGCRWSFPASDVARTSAWLGVAARSCSNSHCVAIGGEHEEQVQ